MRWWRTGGMIVAVGCADAAPAKQRMPTLREMKAEAPNTIHGVASADPVPTPPAGDLEVVHYPAPLGSNVAYASPVRDGAKRPAILWVQGGFDWGIGESAWEAGPPENDQSARVFRDAGVVQMYAALRGFNGNPGQSECFYGEVEDLIAAGKWLAARPDVDPARVYIGGHSTGGTLSMLVAESTPMFRAVFAFGPVADIRHYGQTCLPADPPVEVWGPRAVWPYLDQITTPTWVVEGANGGNIDSFPDMKVRAGSAPVTFIPVAGHDHFSVIRPGTQLIAPAILADTGTPVLPTLTESLKRL